MDLGSRDEDDEGHAILPEDVVVSWYDNVYCPSVRIFRSSERMLDSFHKRGEVDLYVWTSKHADFLRERDGVSLDAAPRAFAARHEVLRALRLLEGIRDRMRPDGSTRRERRGE